MKEVGIQEVDFCGTSKGCEGYKLYDPVSRKFICSRDVIFLGKKFHDFDVQSSTKFDDSADHVIPLMIEQNFF